MISSNNINRNKQLSIFIVTRLETDGNIRDVKVLVIRRVGNAVRWVAAVAIPAALEQQQREQIERIANRFEAVILTLVPGAIVGYFVVARLAFRVVRGKPVDAEKATSELQKIDFFNSFTGPPMLMIGMGLSSMFTLFKIARLIYKVSTIITDLINNMDDDSKTDKIIKKLSSKSNDSLVIKSDLVDRRSRSRDY